MRKSFILGAAVAMAAAMPALAGDLKVGATPVPHAEMLEHVKPALKDLGVNLEIVEFNDYVQPNLATADGSIQANFYQHKPYLDSFVEEHKVDLVSVAGIHIEPMGLYSSKIKKLEDLKEGAKIGIPNDPTNGGRALLLLARHNVITLKNADDIKATVPDIAKNDKKLQFVELEAAMLPRSLNDVDAAVINTNYAMGANLNPLKDAIVIEDSTSPYVNVIVTTSKNSDNGDIKKLVDALRSPATKQFITDKYKGAVVPAF